MTKKRKVSNTISFKNSIKTKLIAIMVLVAAIPLIVAIVISYNTSTKKAKNDALELLAAQAANVEKDYSNVINQNIIALETFANSASTREYLLTRGTASQRISNDEILKEFDAINAYINDGNTSIVLDDTEGNSIIRADRTAGSNIKERDYFQECLSQKKPVVSNILISKTTGERIQNIIVPVFDESGANVIAAIHRSYNLGTLHQFLASSVSDGYICDRTGLMAAHAQFELSPEDVYDMNGVEFVGTTAQTGLFSMEFSGINTFTSWIKEPISGYIVTVSAQEPAIMQAARKSAMIVVIIGAVLSIAAVIISILMARSFTQPIAEVNKSLGALSDGRFVKVSKFDQRKDEFGSISKATNSVISTLSDIVDNIKISASSVGQSSEDLSDMADQISRTAEDVSTAVQEIATGATQQADEIQQATENVGYIGEAVANVKESSENLTDLAGKMKKASEISGKSLVSLQKSSVEMTQKIDEISKTIAATEDAVSSINEKVEGITSIATQTNLLSLNASIEAARAGEAGRGFAVVAEEIGKLADDSKLMADEIKIEMEKLLNQSKAAVSAAADVKNGNDTQQVALSETLDAVNGMLEDINSTVEGVDTISKGAETCETSKSAVVDTMSALSAISEENAASSEQTGASMQELSATVTTLASSAADLRDIAEKLNEDMKFFKS